MHNHIQHVAINIVIIWHGTSIVHVILYQMLYPFFPQSNKIGWNASRKKKICEACQAFPKLWLYTMDTMMVGGGYANFTHYFHPPNEIHSILLNFADYDRNCVEEDSRWAIKCAVGYACVCVWFSLLHLLHKWIRKNGAVKKIMCQVT